MLTDFQKRRFKWYRGIAVVIAFVGVWGLVMGFISYSSTGTFTGTGGLWVLLISLWQAMRFDKILKNDSKGIEQDMRWTTRQKILYAIGVVILLMLVVNMFNG